MKMYIKVPKIFVPEEKEFQIYCAIKLLKGNYITKEEAVIMCGYKNDVKGNDLFGELYKVFERRYKNICGKGYCDSDYWDYKDELE